QYCNLEISTASQHGHDPDWIEAMLFAYLAYMRITKQKLNLSSITGSSQVLLAGDIV
ncbi:hypothetical protein MNBD_GAMMA03-1093, partial [hydrothermal vent metagenome]